MLRTARLAWQLVRPQLRQLAMAIVVIALGVALSSAMLLANRALRDRFDESIDALAGVADLQVTARSGGTLDESLLETVRATDGVRAAAPLLVGMAFAAQEPPLRLRLIGVDMLDDDSVRVYRRHDAAPEMEDPLAFLAQPDSVLVPRALAVRLGVEVGESLTVETGQGRRRLTVRGVLDDAGVARAAAGNLLVMDLFAAQDALGVPGRVTQLDVVLDPAARGADVEARLRAALPEHVDVAQVATRKAELSRAAAAFQLMLEVVATMGLVLAALITANRLSTVYQGRRWEIGVMRTLGARPAGLVGTLLVEAAIVAALGVAAGIPLGLAFAQLIVRPVAETMTLNLQQIVSPTWVAPQATPILVAAAAGLSSGVLAALVPARRAATASVVAVLTQGRSREPAGPTPVRRGVRLAVAGLALALLALQLVVDVGPAAGATMALVAVAGGLAVVPGLGAARRLLGTLLRRAFGVALEDRRESPDRAAGAGAVLMAGVALAIWVGSMRDSFEAYVVQRIMLDRQADLVVDSGFNDVAVGGDDARLPGTILEELARLPGVAAVGAGVNAAVLEPETGIVAADPVRFRDSAFGVWPLDDGAWHDALERVAAGEAVLADANLVARRKLEVGDPVRLPTPSGVLERPLAGVTPTKFRSPGGDVMLSRDLYREYWHDDTVSQAFVVLAPGADPAEVEQKILDALGSRHRLRVLSRDELAAWYADGVRQAYAFLDVLVVLTLVVVSIGTSDALAASVVERTREIGTMRALGASARDVAAQVVAQALAIALVGSTLAILVGYAMSFAFVDGLIPSTLGWRLGLRPSVGVAVAAVVLGALACLAGAALPALRAARMPPARALRYE